MWQYSNRKNSNHQIWVQEVDLGMNYLMQHQPLWNLIPDTDLIFKCPTREAFSNVMWCTLRLVQYCLSYNAEIHQITTDSKKFLKIEWISPLKYYHIICTDLQWKNLWHNQPIEFIFDRLLVYKEKWITNIFWPTRSRFWGNHL